MSAVLAALNPFPAVLTFKEALRTLLKDDATRTEKEKKDCFQSLESLYLELSDSDNSSNVVLLNPRALLKQVAAKENRTISDFTENFAAEEIDTFARLRATHSIQLKEISYSVFDVFMVLLHVFFPSNNQRWICNELKLTTTAEKTTTTTSLASCLDVIEFQVLLFLHEELVTGNACASYGSFMSSLL